MAPTLLLVASVFCSALVSWWATRRPLRSLAGAIGAHWTVRARLTWAVRSGNVLPLVTMPIGFAATSALLVGPLTVLSTAQGGALGALGSLLGAALAGRRTSGRQNALSPVPSDGVPTRDRWLGTMTFVLVGYGHLIMLLVAALAAPFDWSVRLWVVVAGATWALLAWGSGFGLVLARWLGLALPAPPRLAAVVGAASRESGVTPTAVWLLRWHRANAFAFVTTGQLAFTDGALRLLADSELNALAVHELGHVSEPSAVRWLRRVQPLVVLPVVFFKPVYGSLAEVGGDGLLGLVALIVIALFVIGLLRLVARLSRRMEERADSLAHHHEEDAGAYARALEHLYEVNGVPAVLKRSGATHPDLYDRMVAAGVEPEWPKPEPAPVAEPRRTAFAGMLGVVLVSTVGWGIVQVALSSASVTAASGLQPGAERRLVALSSLVGGDANTVATLARLRWNTDGPEAAIPWMAAAAALNPWDAGLMADQAIVLAFAGRCDEALVAMERLDQFEGWGWYADRAHESVGGLCAPQ